MSVMTRLATVKLTIAKGSTWVMTKGGKVGNTIDRNWQEQHHPKGAPPPGPNRINQSHKKRSDRADSRDCGYVMVDCDAVH